MVFFSHITRTSKQNLKWPSFARIAASLYCFLLVHSVLLSIGT
jgi:hypothetical protein